MGRSSHLTELDSIKVCRMAIEREIVGRFIDACVDNHSEAKRLLKQHPDLRHANWMGDEHLLNFLAIEDFANGLRFCLENGFDPNQADGEFGDTPLHYACKLNYVDCVRVLLQFGANPNAVSLILDTPLHCCVSNANADIIDLLITNGADPHYSTDLGETIFDHWPNNADKQAQIATVLRKHNITRAAE